jgi:hypothetical protein
VRELDPGLPITIHTWTQELNDAALFASRMATMALGVLGLMGAMLSITGIFGMAAYSVSKRLRELGIRIALGAQRSEVLQASAGTRSQIVGVGFPRGPDSRHACRTECWLSSCIKPRRAIPWSWPA